jgi:erythromycin esterase-like protein
MTIAKSINLFACALALIFHCAANAQQNQYEHTNLLHAALQDVSVIGIGEKEHGYENVNSAKAWIVAHLLKKENFGALLFESSFVASIVAYLENKNASPRSENFLYPYWITTSIQHLFELILPQENTKPLITGFDMQEDCRFTNLTAYLIQNNIVVNTQAQLLVCDSILSAFIGSSAKREQLLSTTTLVSLLNKYHLIAEELRLCSKLDELNKILLMRCITNRKWLCEYLTISNLKDRMYFRDSLMAQNVIWQKKYLYNTEKIILWAADIHVAKSVTDAKQSRWMGEWLTKIFGEKYFSISVRKGRSKVATNSTQHYPFKFNTNGDKIDAYIYLQQLIKIKPEQWITPCPG